MGDVATQCMARIQISTEDLTVEIKAMMKKMAYVYDFVNNRLKIKNIAHSRDDIDIFQLIREDEQIV